MSISSPVEVCMVFRATRRFVGVSLCAALAVIGLPAVAEAGPVSRVTVLAGAKQNTCTGKLKVKWKRVRGATYQVRWGESRAQMKRATPVAVRGTSTLVGPVGAGGRALVQVRAKRSGRAGAWSRPRAVAFRSAWPSAPSLAGTGVVGGVLFQWPCTRDATRYRVRWSAAPHGKWPEGGVPVSGWLGAGARSVVFPVASIPAYGDGMLAVPYANPVWGRLEAGNARGGVRLSAGWVPVFPAAPDPGPGDPLRIGTYNLMHSPGPGARLNAIAANISSHGLDVVALQEATDVSANALVSTLGPGWAKAPSGGADRQVLYRTARYSATKSGAFAVPNPMDPAHPLLTPWVRLEPVAPVDPARSQAIHVVSAHVTEHGAKSVMDKKRDAGLVAASVMAGVRAVQPDGPVVVAGDLRYLREPWGDVPGYLEAPPTFVRGGYYDAMAAQQKVNIQFPTFNGSAAQSPIATGVAARADYLMLKGFRGSRAYVNVANWAPGGVIPSDHNLVFADLVVPFRP